MPVETYAQGLAGFTGDAFQAEVVRALQQTFTGDGFQRIPSKPQGDGGLDGLSHGRTRGYCIYGPELGHGPQTQPATLRKKIGEKFKADLRRLLEVELKSTKLVHRDNDSLATLLGDPPTTRLQTIILVVNIFEDKRLIGDLNTAFDRYKRASKKRFVDPKCELVIWGPRDVADNTAVTEQALLRVEHPKLFEAITSVKVEANTHEPPSAREVQREVRRPLGVESTRQGEH